MSLFDSPICPLADDLLLLSVADYAVEQTGLYAPANQSSRHRLAEQLVSAATRRQGPTDGKPGANNEVGTQSPEEHPPPSAFLTLATITIQLSMLKQLSQTESSTDLASATCDGLLAMLQPMPVRALRNLSRWESSVLDQISRAMEDLAMTSPVLQDNVKSLLLSFAVHRASLSSVLKVLETVLETETMQIAPQTVDIIKRLRLLQMKAPLACDWTTTSCTFPIRQEPTDENEHEQRFIAPSFDSSYLYVSTRKRLLKIGTGDCRVLGSLPTIAGHVYAETPLGGFVFVIDSKLYTAVRRRGSALIEIFERDPDTLKLMDPLCKLTLPFEDTRMVEYESITTLSTLGDDKGGQTMCWIGPNAWIVGPNVKCYFEVVVRDDTGTLSVGWCAPGFAAADNLRLGGGGDKFCWGVDVLSKEKFHDGARTPWGAFFRKGDTLGCALETDPNGNVTLSFSRNGSWDEPMGKVFTINAHGRDLLQFRPIVSYSCDECDAPTMDVGGVYGHQNAHDTFRFHPPKPDFLPVSRACLSICLPGTGYPRGADMAQLPPLASDGKHLYRAWMQTSDERSTRGVTSLIVESYGIVAGPQLVLHGRRVVKQSSTSTQFIKSFYHPFGSWRMMTNGYGIFIGLVSVTNGGTGHYRSVGIEINDDEQTEYVECPWTIGSQGLDIPQAVVFDSRLNVVWGWDEKLNIIYVFPNGSVGQCLPVGPASNQENFSGKAPSIKVCEFVASSLARLAQPFLLEVPLNGSRNRCAVCDHADLMMKSHTDLFLEPMDPSTLVHLANLAERSAHHGNDTALESFIALTLVNIHVAFCPRRGGPPFASSTFDESVQKSLKKTLFSATKSSNPSLSRLAKRVLCEGIPLFWPSCEDKVGLIRLSFTEDVESSVLQRVMRALNEQLLESQSFPYHRAIVDDMFLIGLFSIIDSGHILVADTAGTLVVGLLCSGFKFLRSIAVEETSYAASQSKKSSPSPSSSAVNVLFALGDEEAKEDEGSSQPALETGAKSPAAYFDDVVSMIVLILDRCIDNKFATCLTSKVLPFALVVLDILVGDFVTGPKTARSMLRIDSQSFPTRLASFALHVVQALGSLSPKLRNSCEYSFTRYEFVAKPIDLRAFPPQQAQAQGILASGTSAHERHLTVHVPFAYRLSITFDARSDLSGPRESIRFIKPGNKNVEPELLGHFAGRSLPGIELPPLTVASDRVECVYHAPVSPSDSSPAFLGEVHEKCSFTILAQRIVKRKVEQRFYLFHIFEALKALLSNVMSATVQSSAYVLIDTEIDLMRWIQNAVFSGGLRSIEDSPPRPALKRGSRASVYSSGDLKAYLQEESESILNDLLIMNLAPPSLAGYLVTGMRAVINRVPFDQGRMTQPAVCAVAAALIRTNGMETEALAFAKAVSNVGAEYSHVRAPPRLRSLWSAAQQMRAWCDSLVVNGRAKRHLEACGMDSSTIGQAEETKDEEGDDTMDMEDREYDALCRLVVARCEFLVRSVYPPPFLRQSRRREDALARWHFLRERYCPKTSRYVEDEPLGAVLRGIRALISIRNQPASPPFPTKSLPAQNNNPPEGSPSIAYTPTQPIRSLRKLVSSDDVLHPLHVRLGKPFENLTLTRRASLSSWHSALKRKPSWLGVETIEEASRSNLSSPASSAGGSARFRRGSAASASGPGVRVKSRAEGGLRRASLDGLLEEVDIVDVARTEHEQSLSESVLSFVQSPSVLRKRDLITVLKTRNERAQARCSGLAIVVAIAQGTDFQSKYGRDLFEFLLLLTMTAIRVCGSNSAVNEQNVMEAHFMTDLTGCSVLWRERATAIFLAFLRIVSHQVIRVTRSFRFRPQRKACDHVKLLLDGVILDYVESDYSLLYRSNVIEAIQCSLGLPKGSHVPAHAWKVFEILFRRCVIDHLDKNSLIGHIFQQQLMDLLMHGIASGPLSDRHMKIEDDDFGEDEEEDGEASPSPEEVTPFTDSPKSLGATKDKTILFNVTDLRLSHAAARFLSKSLRLAPDFSLTLFIRHGKDDGLTNGTLVCVGGDRTKRWWWIDVELDNEGRICIHVTFSNGQWARLRSQCVVDEEAEANIRLCVAVSGGRRIHLFAYNQSTRSATHDSCELNMVPEPLDAETSWKYAEGKTPSPPTAARTRRLSTRVSDTDSQTPCLLAGRFFVGSRPGTSRMSCQGLTVSDIILSLDQSSTPQDFFQSADVPQERRDVDAGEIREGPVPGQQYPRRQFAHEHARVLRSLDLANIALRKKSLIALLRLSTPAAQSNLLRIILDARAPLRVRIMSARVLKQVLKDIIPSEAFLNHLGRCVSRAMPPSSSEKTELVPDPRASAAIADEVVDMMHFLCAKQGNWSMYLSNWIVQKVSALDQLRPDDKLLDNPEIVREACAAFSFCGGKLDSIRVGGKATAVDSANHGAFPIPLVRIVAQDFAGEMTMRDVTEKCRLTTNNRQLELPTSEIDCTVPSAILIQSPAPLRCVEIFVENHRLDSPRSIAVRVGARPTKLGIARPMEVPPREGWFTIYSKTDSNGQGSVRPSTSAVLKPSDDDEDEYWCSIQLKSVWGYAQSCRISKIRVTGVLSNLDGSRQMDDAAAKQEDRFICVPCSEDETDEAEDDEIESLPHGGSQGLSLQQSTDEGDPSLVESERRFAVYPASVLVPWTQPPPAAIMEGVCLATSQDIFEAFQRLLVAINRRVEMSRGAERRLAMDIQVRILKTVGAMIVALSRTHRISTTMASFLLNQTKTHNAVLHMVPVAARFRRQGVPDHWRMRFGSAFNSEDTVRFEPLNAPIWFHRFAMVEVDLTQSGIHSWTFTLLQDASRGDESALFGICTDRNAMLPFQTARSDGHNEEDELDLLLPSPKFRFLRAFDGSAIGAHPPSPMLCVRVGDSVRCELDLDKGTLSMAVNNRPLVCVFSDLVGSVWPCVASYSERGTVVVSISNLRCTPPHPRRKCSVECRPLLDVQVEALTRNTFQQLCVEGEDGSNESEERSLTFMGAPMEEDGIGEDNLAFEEDDFDSEEESERESASLKMDRSPKSDKASDLLAQKSPVLYRVQETTALTPSSVATGAAGSLAIGMASTFNAAMQGGHAAVGGRVETNQGPLNSQEVSIGRLLSPAARYEALLWELLARISQRTFDTMVATWPSGLSPDEFFVGRGLGEAIDSLFRISGSRDLSMELLKVVNEQTLLEFANRGIAGLGNVVLQVKRTLKRPRRKADQPT